MRVLIFEPKYVGHFLGFAAVTANAFQQLGCEVTLLVPVGAEGTEQAKIKLAQVAETVDVRYEIDVPKMYEKWINAKFETDALDIALNQIPTDHLVIPSGDFVLAGLLKNHRLRRRLKALGGVDLVLHNCQQVYPKLGIRQRCKCIFDRLAVSLARGIRLHTVDPFATSTASVSHMALVGNPVLPLPHFREKPQPTISRSAARAKLNLPREGRLLGAIGDLGRRKGTELLIKSYTARERAADQYLVLFGLLSKTAREELAKHQDLVDRGQIIVCNSFISDEQFHDFFFAMDAIWSGFPYQVGIASTHLHAAEKARPVIASDYGAVGWVATEYGLGRAFPGNVASMTEAISWFFEQQDWAPDPDGLHRLLEYHTTENFGRHITRQIRQRLSTVAGEHVSHTVAEGV